MREGIRSVARLAGGWLIAITLVLALAAYRSATQNTYVQDSITAWSVPWGDYWQYYLWVLRAPIRLFSTSGADQLASLKEYLPLSLFYIFTAFIGSYLLGVTKGIADVFWKDRSGYNVVQAGAWVLDAIPMFGLVVLLELGTLYAAMYIKGDPVSMIPDQSFVGGYIIPAVILMWAPMMYLARVISISLQEEFGEQYVLTAFSKGIRKRTVFFCHVFRNCIPKLLNEATTVFTLIVSSLLALEFLAFRRGGAFDMFVAMGHGQLGAKSLYVNPQYFQSSLVTDYLLFFAFLTILFRLAALVLQKLWQVRHHA